jgi:hypothetical protein
MSYEGYYQVLCEEGHLFIVDAYDWQYGEEEPNICPICGKKPVWENAVDDTNCDQFGLIHLQVKIPGEECICRECGIRHIKKHTTYYIPKGKGRLL